MHILAISHDFKRNQLATIFNSEKLRKNINVMLPLITFFVFPEFESQFQSSFLVISSLHLVEIEKKH